MLPTSRPIRFGLAWLIRLAVLPVGLWMLTIDSSPAQTLHAIVVADTKDPVLARPSALDIEVIHRQLVQAAAAIGYQLNEQIISDADFGRKQLTKAIQALSPRPDDIILFYYTGHGYNLTGRADRFPVLLLEKKGPGMRQNPGLLTIHTLLKQKKARLCITLGDCCNNIAVGIRGQPSKRVLPKSLILTNDSMNAAYRNLLLGVTGDALIASSAPPQRSVAHPDSGSFYTRAFDDALDMTSQNQTRSWASLLRDAQTRLTRHPATRTKQSIYQLNLTPTRNPTSSRVALNVALRTDRGRENVDYRAGEQMQLDVKVNRPCHLRVIYVLADGTKTLLENDLIIEPGQANRFVRIAPTASFICTAPFGTEHLLVYASDEPFCPLTTKPNPTLYVRMEGDYLVLVGSMAAMTTAVTCTTSPATVASDRIQITTRESTGSKP